MQEMIHELLVVVGTAFLSWFFFRLRLRTAWTKLTDYYYTEHVYPLVKTDPQRAWQRERAWAAFKKLFRV